MCSKCGMAGARVAETRPSLDDRYAVGFCPKCAPPPSRSEALNINRPVRRPTVQLIRDDLWDASELARRDQAEADRKLLRDFGEADEDGRIRGTAREGRDGVIRSRFVTEKQADEARRRLAIYDREAGRASVRVISPRPKAAYPVPLVRYPVPLGPR